MTRGAKVGYGIPRGMRERYEQAVQKYSLMRHILCIQECPGADFNLTSAARLSKYGYGDYEAITLITPTVDINPTNTDNVAGRTVPVSGPRGNLAAIFLRASYDDCPDETTLWIVKYGVLFHEFGHADDFRLGRYTDLAKGSSDWEKAETFADNFAEVHLNEIRCDKVVHGRKEKCGLWEVYQHFGHQGVYHKVN
jgi:hypothetical protein